MNLNDVIQTLKLERDKLDQAIAILQGIESPERRSADSAEREIPRTRRNGRKPRPPVKATAENNKRGVVCDKCGRTFGRPAELGNHRKACSGAAQRPKMMRPTASEADTPARPNKIRCDERNCEEEFESARALGIHKTRTHYGERSLSGSSLGDGRLTQ